MKVAENSEVYKQVQMIGLTTDDLIQMKRMQAYVLKKIDTIVDRFYEN